MPPNIGDSSLSVSVTLAPVRGFDDTRVITLKPGEPCLIGRASKSNFKNLDPRRDNALFDCPVISRAHAELSAHLWDMVENQVTITDKGSMHGTRVNGEKLREGEPRPLRSGDTIQFGEKVTRGDSAHDGVVVTFSHHRNFTQDSSTLATHTPAKNPSGVYSLTFTSDEESDYGSDDNVSIIGDTDEVMEVSSAKTTPDNTMAKLGSQEQPIELDQPEKSKRTVVQDSMGAQASIVVPESLPIPPRRPTSNFINVDSDSDDESAFVKRDAGPLTDGLRPARAMSRVSMDQDGDESDDEVEYPNNYDVENDSASDASELNRFDHPEDSDEEVYGEVTGRRSISPELTKEASPELRSSGQGCPPAPAAPASVYMPPPMEPNSSYIRPLGYGMESSPQPFTYLNTHPPAFAGQPALPRPSFFGSGGAGGVDHASMPVTSRWDKLPHNPGFGLPAEHGGTRREQYQPPAWHRVPYSGTGTHASSHFANTGALDSNYRPRSPELPLLNSSFTDAGGYVGYSPQSPKMSGALAPTGGRISIPDIVENEVVDVDNDSSSVIYPDFVERSSRLFEEAKSMVDEASAAFVTGGLGSPPASKTGSMGTKRKAVDEEDGIPAGESESHQLNSGPFGDGIAIEGAPRAKKRAKASKAASISTPGEAFATTSSARASAGSIAFSIAKYAAVASAGGMGTLAFLCSPASEQLLNWMS